MNKFKFGGMVLIAAVFLVVFATIVIAGQVGSGGDTQTGDEPVVDTAQQGKTRHAKEAAQDVKVLLNGEELIFSIPPLVIDGRVMVSACELAEKLGAFVQWDVDKTELTIINVVDVSLDDRFYRNIMSGIRLGLIDVPRDGRIEPNRYVTVAEFITMLGRLHETWSEPIGTPGVSPDYVRYLEWAVDIGIIQGNESGDLKPYALITYEQLVVFAFRYISIFRDVWVNPAPPLLPIIGPPPINLSAKTLAEAGVSYWAISAVQFFYLTDLFGNLRGIPLTFRPQSNVSQVYALVILVRMNARYNLAAQRQEIKKNEEETQ